MLSAAVVISRVHDEFTPDSLGRRESVSELLFCVVRDTGIESVAPGLPAVGLHPTCQLWEISEQLTGVSFPKPN
jgi:hypothetical protein